MQVLCGQCRYRFDAPEDGRKLVPCPRCAHEVPLRAAEEENGEQEILPSDVVDASISDAAEGVPGEELGFAEVARKTDVRKIPITCKSCGKSFKVSARLAGKTGKCLKCKAKIRVPYPEEDEDEAALVKRFAGKEQGRLDLRAKRAAAGNGAPAEGPEELVAADLSPEEAAAADVERQLPHTAEAAALEQAIQQGDVPRRHKHRRSHRHGPPGQHKAPAADGQPVPVDAANAGAEPPPGGEHLEGDLADMAASVAAAPATVDEDDGRRRRNVVTFVGLLLGLCLAAVIVIFSYRAFIRPHEEEQSVALADGNRETPTPSASARPEGTATAQPTPPEGTATPPASTDPNAKGSIFDIPGVTQPRSTKTPAASPTPAATATPASPTPSPTPPPTPKPAPGPRVVVGLAKAELFLADGYCPAPPDRVYWKVEVELSAGDQPMTLDAFGEQAVLLSTESNFPCAGVLAGASWPSQRIARRRIEVAAGQSVKAPLLFEVPQTLQEGRLALAGFPPVDVRPIAGAQVPGGTILAGKYAEQPPRNLQPLLRDPVMAAIQSAARLELVVSSQEKAFALSIPAAGVTGTASPQAGGVCTVHLQRGQAALDCKLRAASGGKTVVLYLEDAPFHQITFAMK